MVSTPSEPVPPTPVGPIGRGRWRLPRGLAGVSSYLLLAPAVLVVVAVLVYPLIDGVRASFSTYSYGRAVGDAGWSNYGRVLEDPHFWSSLWVTVRFLVFAVAIETVLGVALALFCARELRSLRWLRSVLILPMIITPVIVGIVFRLIYASDTGLITQISLSLGGGPSGILNHGTSAFFAVVAVDVWEWTPLMFLIALAGLQSLPVEPFEAARVDGAGPWRTFSDHKLPMLMPVLMIAVILRTIDAFGTFDQVFVLTAGGPGEATKLISIYGYETAFKFFQVGQASAMLLLVALAAGLMALAAVAAIKRQARKP